MKVVSILFLIISFQLSLKAEGNIFKKKLLLMGCDFEITVVAQNENEAKRAFTIAIDEIERIEGLISSWKDDSQTSTINQNSGVKAVAVDDELMQLIQRSIAISELTDGAFDITYASMDRIWKFDGSMKQIPEEKLVKASASKVGYKKVSLDPKLNSVFLTEEGMKIGFGAIGKGYAADRAKELLVKAGFNSGIVNASGDMNVWGQKPDGTPWKVAITNPLSKEKSFALIPIHNQAVVTSGDYEKFIEIDGQRYSHIIDPRTGMPAQGIISVTVFAPKAELADALATSVFVMGDEVGLDRINQIPNVECIIVKADGSILQSNNIQISFE
jgi:thiamine biosynthesis lipoprotein